MKEETREFTGNDLEPGTTPRLFNYYLTFSIITSTPESKR